MELQQLKYFLVAARTEQITRAAEEIHIAQPALTQSIKRLEKELGVTLFIRSGRNVKLTAEGVYLKKTAERVIFMLDEMKAEIIRSKAIRESTVRLSVAAASLCVTEAVVAYKKIKPEVAIEFVRTDIPDCDIRLTSVGGDMPDGYTGDSFSIAERLYIGVSANRATKIGDGMPLSFFKDDKFLCVERSKPLYRLCERYCIEAGFIPDVAFEGDSPIAVCSLIAADVGVGFVPAFSWGNDITGGIKLIKTDRQMQRIVKIDFCAAEKSAVKREFYNYLTDFLQTQKSGAIGDD